MFLAANYLKKDPIEFNPYRGRYNIQIDTPGFTRGYSYLSPLGFDSTSKKELAVELISSFRRKDSNTDKADGNGLRQIVWRPAVVLQ